MNIFNVPHNEYTDHYDRARYRLSWRVCVFMFFILNILGVLLFSAGQPAYMPTFAGALLALVFIIILKYTRRFQGMAAVFSIIGTFLCQFTLLYFKTEYHMVDVLWMMLITLYTFFMLGKNWGVAVLIANTAGTVFFVLYCLNENLSLIGSLEPKQVGGLAVNFIICNALIGFVLLHFLRVIRKAENDLREVNEELKEQNETVALQSREKTVMLREIHHRVKNNLQVISSLLRLQSEEFEDSESRQKFNDTIHRVRSMAHIHERMYQSEHLSRIDLEGYIETLSAELIHSYQITKSIDFEVRCEMREVHPKSLVSLALIFNELVSNSLKHAFTNTESPRISIDLRFGPNDTVLLSYYDNGEWKTYTKKSFGMELIDSLSEQLNGEFNIIPQEGTRFDFIFDRKSIMEDD